MQHKSKCQMWGRISQDYIIESNIQLLFAHTTRTSQNGYYAKQTPAKKINSIFYSHWPLRRSASSFCENRRSLNPNQHDRVYVWSSLTRSGSNLLVNLESHHRLIRAHISQKSCFNETLRCRWTWGTRCECFAVCLCLCLAFEVPQIAGKYPIDRSQYRYIPTVYTRYSANPTS